MCSDQKTLHGCGPGSKHEKFMKKHCRKTCGLCPMLVLVTGGRGESGRLDSVELLNMDGTWNCPMPTMPEPRMGHTQTGPVACGGSGTAVRSSCVTFFSGGDDWVKTHNLTQDRRYHSAWASPRGVMLMGGFDHSSKTTTNILTENRDTIPSFTLDHETE